MLLLFRAAILFFSLVLLLLSGCIAHGPKYSRIEKVLQIKPGMSKTDIENTLDIGPYDIKSLDSSGTKTIIYKYRTTHRRTLPFLLKDTNGQEIRGKFVDLYVYYTPQDTMVYMNSMTSETEIQQKKININTLITFLTVTAPALLVYLGVKYPQ